MDIRKLQQAVFEKTSIRIDEIDPVFTVVALNEAMFEQMVATYSDALAKNNAELDEKIGSMVILHRKIAEASRNLVDRAEQAHLRAALKAATEAKADIMTAARLAISLEMERTAAIIINAGNQLADAGKRVQINARRHWVVSMTQGVAAGAIGAMIVIAAEHLAKN